MNNKFVEDSTLAGTRITTDGYLVASVKCARTGIQDYLGSEVGSPLDVVRVYRPESEVFSKDSLASYPHKPATNDHSDEPVTSENWREYSIGSIGEDVVRDGEYVRIPLILMDGDAISDVQKGKREVSMGYEMTLDFTEGVTPDGDAYDAVMRNLRMNHIAIVQKGRAGKHARIGDNWGASPLLTKEETMSLKTIVVDGLSVETTEAGEKAITKLQDSAKALKDAHTATIAAKDKELATKDAEIAKLKGKILDDSAIDARVAERSAVISKASAICKDSDFTGMSDIEIKTAAVKVAFDSVSIDGQSEDYVTALFDAAKAPEVKDTVRDALADKKPVIATDNGQSAYEQRLSSAWKGK